MLSAVEKFRDARKREGKQDVATTQIQITRLDA